jgi:hypothetical protein
MRKIASLLETVVIRENARGNGNCRDLGNAQIRETAGKAKAAGVREKIGMEGNAGIRETGDTGKIEIPEIAEMGETKRIAETARLQDGRTTGKQHC